MNRFARLCERRAEPALAEHWRARARRLNASLEAVAWDGAWWRRAFDDDGRPLGSQTNAECRIDSIAQSWAVLSGAQCGERSREGLAAALRELVHGTPALVRLFWPPFATTPREPGYVKAYPPGVRENGGQYNHAAAWLAWALAEVGEADSALLVLDAIDPIRRSGRSDASLRSYRGEPYVLAGDVASSGRHAGRCGWTWYTGSAAWTWRFAVEQLLGIRREGGGVRLQPHLPSSWDGFEAVVRGEAGSLRIRVRVGERAAAELRVDGALVDSRRPIPFPRDGGEQQVELVLPRAAAGSDATPGAVVPEAVA
jgi:cyclic beta-1,2-glucan synthetase